MSLWRLILREIRFRKLNFLLGVLSVAAAVTCLVAQTTVLRRHDLRTERLVAAKEAETQAKMDAYEDDVRRITVNMGFNVMILPKSQNLGDLYADDFAAETMPEEYAERLARSRVATINHVLPSLQQKVKWPERERTILLMGVRGEVYVRSAKQTPILEPVPEGRVVVGYELHRSLGLKAGGPLVLMDRTFTIERLNPERGTKDDITLWIGLRAAQELLGKPGRINGILALDCTCAADRLSLIREEILKILPDTQVIEFASQAIARSEARTRAAAEAASAVAAETDQRNRLRDAREALAAVLVPAVSAGSALWIGLLALANVRDRRAEIGLFRAIGLRGRHVLFVFLGKAVLTGLAGAGLGIAAALAFAAGWTEATAADAGRLEGVDWRWLAGAAILAPILAALASWLPAMVAARQDPAVVLRET
jgi:hypothetical protein